MIIVWRKDAARDLDAIFDYVVERNRRAAAILCDLIEQRVGQLRDFANIGRLGRVRGTRELVIAGTPYIVAYRVKGNTIDVLAVIHGRRKWPHGFPE
ncbi:MAG TPA: type II toxin-antitoxin system RelE/ParE family toxin [Hyphomicrobiaceae bacterium]|nr:type II toxin-antitoxin system RelE/ParE family toxin [Hyphomicrobiaceae bacterium]